MNSKVRLKHRNNARFKKNEFQVCVCDNNIGDGYRYTTVNSNHIIFLSMTFKLLIMCGKITTYPSTITEGKVIVVENFFFLPEWLTEFILKREREQKTSIEKKEKRIGG